MKIINIADLNTVDPGKDCIIIKNVFSPDQCDEVLKYLKWFSDTKADNERYLGENWHYWVTSHGNNFDSFLFQNLGKLDSEIMISFYKKLYSIYNTLGETTHYNNFEQESINQDVNIKTVNPLVFWYKAGVSKFGWHKHPAENQRFQLLTNLTKPGYDYVGGETVVYMGEGLPISGSLENCEVFDSRFQKGDVFSFPYDKWHKVNAIEKGSGGWESKVSLLMPLAKRYGGEENEYYDGD